MDSQPKRSSRMPDHRPLPDVSARFDLSILTPRRVTYPTFSRVAWPILRDQLSLQLLYTPQRDYSPRQWRDNHRDSAHPCCQMPVTPEPEELENAHLAPAPHRGACVIEVSVLNSP